MLAQVIHSDNFDLRLMGLLGFNGALIVADIALKDALGSGWWLPLPWLALSSFLCFRSPSSSGGEPDSDLGPKPKEFLGEYGSTAPQDFKSQLLAQLDAALEKNRAEIHLKQERLLAAEIVLVGAIIISIMPLIGVSEVIGWYVYSGVAAWHLAQTVWHWIAWEAPAWAWHRMTSAWHLIEKIVG